MACNEISSYEATSNPLKFTDMFHVKWPLNSIPVIPNTTLSSGSKSNDNDDDDEGNWGPKKVTWRGLEWRDYDDWQLRIPFDQTFNFKTKIGDIKASYFSMTVIN